MSDQNGLFNDVLYSDFFKSLEGFELLQQSLGQMQELLLARERRVRELEEALREMELRVERSEMEARVEAQRLEARMCKMEERMSLVERELLVGVGQAKRRRRKDAKGLARQLPLEARMHQLESSVRNVMDRVFSPEEMETNSSLVESSPSVDSTSGPMSSTVCSEPSSSSLATNSVTSLSPSINVHSNLEHRVDDDDDDLGNILKAVEDGRLEDVETLLQAGVNSNIADPLMMTPLHLAVMKVNSGIVSLLLRRGANVHATTSFGNTPIHLAAAWDRVGLCVSFLIQAGSNVDCRGQNGYTPLHWASLEGNEAAVRVLLEAGANKTVTDDAGMLPVDIASGNVVRALLS